MMHCKAPKYAILIILSLLFLTSFILSADDTPSGKIISVVIDAGHGGVDPGAIGLTAMEKDIALSIALKVGALINDSLKEVKVLYTRKDDVFIPLNDRADFANKNHADLFISIHVNSNPKPNIVGVETYVMGIQTSEKNMEVAMKENAVITYEKDYKTKYEGYDPNSAESFIIFSLVQNIYIDQSLNFASYIQENAKNAAKRYDRGVKQAGFLVLWRSSMPSVLVETGFISNKNEEKYLLTEKGQDDIAYSIYKAFAQYKQSIEKNQNIEVNPNINSTNQTNDSTVKNQNELFFRIQILSSSKSISRNAPDFNNSKKIKGAEEIKEYSTGKIYKYAIGKNKIYADAQNMLKEVKRYYPDAFIVAEENGQLIPLQKVLKK
jgi:N-acetylmuramoyl-L-alanine amidase